MSFSSGFFLFFRFNNFFIFFRLNYFFIFFRLIISLSLGLSISSFSLGLIIISFSLGLISLFSSDLIINFSSGLISFLSFGLRSSFLTILSSKVTLFSFLLTTFSSGLVCSNLIVFDLCYILSFGFSSFSSFSPTILSSP